MDVEAQTLKNTQDIGALTNTVTKIATMFEYSEKSRIEEREDVKQAVAELRTLNDKMTAMASVLQGLDSLKDKQADTDKKVSEHETRINVLEQWKDRAEGATGAVRIIIHGIWAIVTSGVLSAAYYIVRSLNGGSIGGE